MQEKDIPPLFMAAGDKIVVSHTDGSGETTQLIEATIEEDCLFDTVKIVKFEDEFGLKFGYAGVIGKK
jgi:hypothetical protein